MKVDPNTPQTTELAIGGMTCASCVAHVKKSLQGVPGVSEASVNLATERATVTHEPNVALKALVAAVDAAGYKAKRAPEPTATALDASARERDFDMARRRAFLAFGVVLLVPSLILGMTPISFGGKDWVMLVLALLAWAVMGFDYHVSALKQLRHGTSNMDTLISLGGTAAFAYSIYATFTGHEAFYETTVAIVVLPNIGKYLEIAGRNRTDVAIRHLLGLRPSTALLVAPDGHTQTVPVDSIRVDAIVEVRAGDRIPVDGVVTAGESAIDTSMVTGESVPQEVAAGDHVVGGTVNGDGLLRIRATAVGAGTVLARIVKAVQDAQGSEAPVQRLADRVAGVFVPSIIVIAVGTFIAWIATGHSWPVALMIAVAVIVVACPCAMGLATPTAVMAGVGAGARRGILFKNAEAIQRVGEATTVVFDKTGTLTQARPTVMKVHGIGIPAQNVLALAASAERGSTHPFAHAIASMASAIEAPGAQDVRVYRGKGVAARVNGADVLVGTPAFLRERGVSVDALTLESSDGGATQILVADAGRLVGTLDIADPLRPTARDAVAQVRALGLDVSLVSGDAPGPVRSISDAVGIANSRAEALPDEKAAYVKSLEASGRRTIFVGDGINDAPALASASVGMAMGGGAEIAIEAADAAILSDDPRAVATSIKLSRATMQTIRQNLFWAFAYNIVLVPLAALGFVNPTYAAGAMAISSVFVVGNSLLLLRR